MRSNVPPTFISFEGPDGSGKSTQVARVNKWLQEHGVPTLLTYEPGDTEFGQRMRDMLLHGNFNLDPLTELMLYAADRREHVRNVIKPALEQGLFVISDRYIDSTLAYQGYGKGIDIEFIRDLNRRIIGEYMPTLTFFLDLPPSVSLQRLETFDNTENEDISFHNRVVSGYKRLAKENPSRFIALTLDEKTTKDDIFNRIIKHIIQTWPDIFAGAQLRNAESESKMI